jgi:AraC family transcriptional regulator, regulatory protein of adaptative response / DNA-3-methyladenine glycosylase II
MIDDPDRCYEAIRARDPRFDGWFVLAVTSTGIYCRPSCPATTPKRENARFLPTSAAAQAAGFRACLRCRPDAAPGSPEWDTRADLVARAMRLIADGVVERAGVPGLAARLGYSERHVHRQLVAEVGVGPLALARAQRARTARILIETTRLPFTQVAFAAGFASVRQFNDTVQAVFGRSPTELRTRRRSVLPASAEAIALRLAHRRPASLARTIDHLAARAIPGVEAASGDGYRRTLALPHGTAEVRLTPRGDHVAAELRLDDLRDLTTAVSRCRRLLDLDADPVAIDERLGADPRLEPLVAADPGLRVPRSPDPWEALVRTIVGQQIGVTAARTILGRLVTRCDGVNPSVGVARDSAPDQRRDPAPDPPADARLDTPAGSPDGRGPRPPAGTLERVLPSADALAEADLAGIGLTDRRTATLQRVARAVAVGSLPLDAGVDRDELRRHLASLPGIGPWSVEEVALRGLGDPDAFPATDLGLRRVARRVGLPSDPRELAAAARAWSPWRAYAAQHLWRLDAAPAHAAA